MKLLGWLLTALPFVVLNYIAWFGERDDNEKYNFRLVAMAFCIGICVEVGVYLISL